MGVYRYGFNGKENDNEVKGAGNQQDYGMRIYDTRLGRFLSVDPLTKSYPHYTPYSFAGNKPIKYIDIDGAEEGRHWYDYDINDLINWIGKPDNPIKDDGFVHKLTSATNRNLNLLYHSWVIATGKDYSSSDYPKMTRMDAAFNLTTVVIFHQSVAVAAKPSAPVLMEMQMKRNAAAMGTPVKTTTQAAAVKSTSIELKSFVSPVEEDGVAVVRDMGSKAVGRGWLSNGELNLSIKTDGSTLSGRGSDVFRSLYNYVNSNFDEVLKIRGTWRPEMPSNLNQFNALLKEGKSITEAAFGTFTGSNAKSLGFTNVEILSSSVKDKSGVYKSVDLLFTK